MAKISVSIPNDIIEFIDSEGKNRSKIIVTILEEFKKKKQQDELAKAYAEYADFCKKDKESRGFEETSAIDAGEDL